MECMRKVAELLRGGEGPDTIRVISEDQIHTEQRHARERMARVMHANFDENDLALTLTYRENQESREQAVKQFQKWLRKVRRLYKQAGAELKYIWQMEKSKKGRYHVHVVISGGVDRDTLEKLWNHGYANTKRLQFDESGLAALARYITKSNHEDSEERSSGNGRCGGTCTDGDR
jgi:hypothetical protein